MKRPHFSLFALALVIAAGCSDPTPASRTPNSSPAVPATQPERTPEKPRVKKPEVLAGLEAAVSEMDLYMHDIEPTGNERRMPTLWVHAASGELKPDNSWALSDAQAVIYRDQDEDIRLRSKAGHFDESQKIAVLEGGVTVSAGEMELSTETVTYSNENRVVETLSPVTISDGNTMLLAEAAMLHPDEGEVTLTNVSGTLSLAETFE